MEDWKVLEKGGLSGVGGNQVTLRSLILVFLCWVRGDVRAAALRPA